MGVYQSSPRDKLELFSTILRIRGHESLWTATICIGIGSFEKKSAINRKKVKKSAEMLTHFGFKTDYSSRGR